MKVVFAPRALRDLHAIACFLDEHNPAGARRVIASIKSSIETLEYLYATGHGHLPLRL